MRPVLYFEHLRRYLGHQVFGVRVVVFVHLYELMHGAKSLPL